MFDIYRWFRGISAAVMICGALTLQARTFRETCAAAERGDADAQFELGLYHVTGICVPKSKAEAAKWFRRAAKHGHAAARAVCRLDGHGAKGNVMEAFALLRKAGEHGDSWAQIYLGMHYGSRNDAKRAFHWFHRAAERGNAWGQLMLGMYCLGITKGMPQDHVQGFHWLRRAAGQGHPYAQALLAGCYSGGKGTPRDMGKAVHWLHLAAGQGYEPAKAALRKMRR